jgi:hypothetical protein
MTERIAEYGLPDPHPGKSGFGNWFSGPQTQRFHPGSWQDRRLNLGKIAPEKQGGVGA